MYVELQPVYCNASGFSEDITVTITLEANGVPVNIAGWTLAPHLYAPNGQELVGAITATITNAAAGQVQLAIIGQTLQAGEYGFTLTRTDPNNRTFNDTGLLTVTQFPPALTGGNFPPSPATWEMIKNRAAEMLSTINCNLPQQFQGLSYEGEIRAWVDVYMHFVNQGYSGPTIMATDTTVLRHWVIEHGAVMAIISSAALAEYDLSSIKEFDPLGRDADGKTKPLYLTQGGNPVAPQANESPIGGVSFGRIAAADRDAAEFDRMGGFGGYRRRGPWG